MRDLVRPVFFLLGVACLVLRVLVSCKSPEQFGATAAESAYTGALLRCVDQAPTLQESRECRARVNLEWGIVEKEAGTR